MSSVLTVNARQLYKALSTLKPLFPKGSTEMPLGISTSKGLMKIVCVQGLVYQASVPVDDEDAINNITIMYHDIASLLPSEGSVEIEFTQAFLNIYTDSLDAKFPIAYSVVEEQDFSKLVFSSISNSGFVDGLKSLLNMNLDKLYNQISPVVIHNGIALQRFQNVWVQVRALGLNFDAVLDSEHVKVITKFVPREVCTSVQGTLVFRNDIGVLQVPCKPDNDKSKITDLMDDLCEPVTLHTKSFLEKVKQIAKVNARAHCTLTLYQEGLKTTVSSNNTEIGICTGNCHSKVLQVCKLPIQVWITFLKGLDSDIVQVLTGGGKICLRTNSIVIVARVLL